MPKIIFVWDLSPNGKILKRGYYAYGVEVAKTLVGGGFHLIPTEIFTTRKEALGRVGVLSERWHLHATYFRVARIFIQEGGK